MVKDLQKTTITTENTEALRAHRGINSTKNQKNNVIQQNHISLLIL